MDIHTAIRAYSYIRFSTPEQAEGDSLRRQLEASIAYAEEHGLILDDKLNMRDLGVSAFRGANIEKGRLGAFINAVEEGLVPAGSYLLVESLDRLSRDQVMNAFQIFSRIIELGITIVTLMDRHKYSKESLEGPGSMNLIFGIIVMSRAYEESATKSKRRHLTWNEQKRKALATGHKMTKKLPFWLSLPDPRGDFVVIDEAAAVVRRVFELAKIGLGFHKIAQTLNAEGVPSPAARNYTKERKDHEPRTWATSSVGYLLKNEAVIGNLVMAEVKADKKEAPVPQRLEGYYPPVIDEELFYAIQGKRKPKRGKTDALKTNLFTGLLVCGYCKGPMQVDTNTKANYRRSRICCQRKRRGLGCICKTWPYEEFEEDFFTFVHEVQLEKVLSPTFDDTALVTAIEAASGKLAAVEKALATLMGHIENDTYPPELLKPQLLKRQDERKALLAELATAKAQLEAERSYQARAAREIETIREQITTLRDLPPKERVLVRYAVAERIATVVQSVTLYPAGSDLQLVDVDSGELSPRDAEPHFRVEFRNGWTGVVKPSSQQSGRFNLSKPGDT